MLKKVSTSLIALFACIIMLFGFGNDQQTCEQIDRKQLREKLVQLGYEIKDIVTDPGKEKYSVTLTRDALDIPVALELSANAKYIWLTVNLGSAKAETSILNSAFLKQNAKIQPSMFYVTEKGLLMMGLPINNLGVTNAFLRDRIESIAGNVGSTKSIWQ
jgi:hypothetical protein